MDTLIDKAIRPKDDDDYYKDQRAAMTSKLLL